MSTHVNPPWKSFLLFLIVAGIGWAGYEFLYVKKMFTGGSAELLSQDQRDKMRARIVGIYADDKCFEAVRGNINWRVREDYYRVEIVVSDGCEDRAKTICKQIAEMLEEEYNVRSSVWAFDSGGRQVANHVL